MTATIVDDLTDTKSDKNRECVGQGVANIATGFIGGMAGCAMIGQSVINVKSGGRGRLSTLQRRYLPAPDGGVPRRLGRPDPDGRAGGGDDHGLHRHLQLGFPARPAHASQELSFVMLSTVAVTVATHDLAMGVLTGVLLSGFFFAHKVGQIFYVRSLVEDDGRTRTYRIFGQVFFASADRFRMPLTTGR
jgi:SulP family sulfate permease